MITKKQPHFIITFFLLFFLILRNDQLTAQTGFYTAPGANFFVHSDTVGFLVNVVNRGNFGTKPGAVIRFMGIDWQNDSTASFPNENSYTANISIPNSFSGNGGFFWFDNNIPTAPAFGLTQIISGGGYSIYSHNGPGFPNLQIDNKNNLLLRSSSKVTDLQIKNNLNFINGKLILGDNGSLFVGTNEENSMGSISGYTEKNYVVTGNSLTGGFLYRGKIGRNDSQVVFPVGATIDYYSPVIINNKGAVDNFRVRPFNAIYSRAITGTLGNQKFVQTTWNIGKENANVSDLPVEIALQHPEELEGIFFNKERDSSYITMYNPEKLGWDTVPTNKPQSPGSITTGTYLNNNYINIRNLTTVLTNNGFFSKTYMPKRNIIGLSKKLDSIQLNADGSYNLYFTFIIENQFNHKLKNIQVSDNLENAFTSAMSWQVISLTNKSSSTVSLNSSFTGLKTDSILTLTGSTLAPGETDTIKLALKLNTNKLAGTFYNTALVKANDANTNDTIVEYSSNGLNTAEKNRNKTPIEIINSVNNLHIPGGFSPNNDGVNDLFVIGNSSLYNITVEIYNRWQNLVYDSKGYYNNDWDGVCRESGSLFNQKLPEGTYFYVLQIFDKVTGELKQKPIGFITLKR